LIFEAIPRPLEQRGQSFVEPLLILTKFHVLEERLGAVAELIQLLHAIVHEIVTPILLKLTRSLQKRENASADGVEHRQTCNAPEQISLLLRPITLLFHHSRSPRSSAADRRCSSQRRLRGA
jgi:hypothetical protein